MLPGRFRSAPHSTGREVRPTAAHTLAFCGLALAVAALFSQVLDTGFWSPEDLRELGIAARARATGDSSTTFRPSLAGGYFTNPLFALEFRAFSMNPRPYFLVNMLVHLLNSFVAYALISTLFHSRKAAFMAALLFALAVGSYGKNLMFATGVSSLVYSLTVLLGTLLYVLNEKENAGRPIGMYAFGFYLLFLGSLFMRGGTFSLIASFAFYNLFFRQERKRPILHTNLIVCLAVATGALIEQLFSGHGAASGADAGAFIRNLPGYLILMVFPLHQSELLSTAPPLVRAIYAAAPTIRVLVGLAILSYSLFGLVFGGRALRFYIAWMYVMVVPFAFFRYPDDWLNLRFLYLVSVGFCVLLTIGTLYAFRLLAQHRLRRFVPFAIPVFYILLSAALIRQLDRKNEQLARAPATEERLAQIAALLGS
jgi:hypothetical protein